MFWLIGLSLSILVTAATNPAVSGEIDPQVLGLFQNLSLPVPSLRSVIYCHGFNCIFRTPIGFSASDYARMAQLMASGKASAESERRALALTEVWFEKRVAPLAGTAHAKARSGGLVVGGDPTQLDCIDTTANTSSLLIVLDDLRLLYHHRLSAPISRLLTGGGPHFTAVVKERKTGQGWTVDPWTHDHGQLPDVWRVQRWLDGG